MRDLMKLFQKHYSAVNSSDGGPNNNNCTVEENLEHLQKIGFNARHRKSLQSTRPLRGLSIVDSFFSKPIAGKRYPKCKHFVFDWLILWILCFLNEQFSIRLCSIVLCASFDIQYRIDLFERNPEKALVDRICRCHWPVGMIFGPMPSSTYNWFSSKIMLYSLDNFWITRIPSNKRTTRRKGEDVIVW